MSNVSMYLFTRVIICMCVSNAYHIYVDKFVCALHLYIKSWMSCGYEQFILNFISGSFERFRLMSYHLRFGIFLICKMRLLNFLPSLHFLSLSLPPKKIVVFP